MGLEIRRPIKLVRRLFVVFFAFLPDDPRLAARPNAALSISFLYFSLIVLKTTRFDKYNDTLFCRDIILVDSRLSSVCFN
jgi:hypothetical protein